MKTVRIFFASALVVLVGVVMPADVPVSAQSGGICGKIMPSGWFDDWSFVTGAGGTGALLSIGPASKPTVLAGGAAVGGAASAGAASTALTVAGVAASIVGGMEAGCRIHDWITGDPAAIAPVVGSTDVVTADSFASCSLFGVGNHVVSGSATRCFQMVLPPTMPTVTAGWFGCANDTLSACTQTRNGVTINPTPTVKPSFLVTGGTSGGYTYGAPNTNYHGRNWFQGSYNSNMNSASNTRSYGASSTVVFMYSCQNNVGSVCGQPPGQSWALGHASNTAIPWHVITDGPASIANRRGWERRIVSDLRCWNGVSGGGSLTTWVRAESEPFWDSEPSSRVVTPECPVGHETPIGYRIARVPVGISCTLGGCADPWVMSAGAAPGTWTSASAPDWAFCASSGVDCGTPAVEVVGGVDTCVWGGHTSPSSFCTPSTHTGPGTSRGARPSTDAVITTALDPTVGEELSTSHPITATVPGGDDGGGGTGVTVDIPIDEGEGECAGRAGCIAVTDIGSGDEDECWVNGWGWFNPAEWVLRPGKCALRWAFVPEDPAGWMAEQQDKLADKAPFSFGVQAFEVVDAATDPSVDATPFCLDGLSTDQLDSGEVCADVGASGLQVDSTRQQWMLAALLAFTLIIGVFGLIWMLW